MRVFGPALAASVLLLLVAPFWGVMTQAFLQSSVPRGVLIALAIVFGVGVLGVLTAGVLGIRRNRLPRYLLLSAALLLAAVPAFFVERQGLITEAVERIHLVLFSAIAFLFYRAFTRAPARFGWYAAPLTWVATSIVGITDESVQGLIAVRTGEIYDIGLNAYSAAIGTMLWVAIVGLPEADPRWPVSGRRHLGRLLAAGILLLAVFYQANHLGYRIEDPDIGTFATWVRPGGFDELNQERRSRWATKLPGPPFAPLELEDRFLTEASWRLRHRNHRYRIEDWFSAWHENLILERYFPAVLDLPQVIVGKREPVGGEPQFPGGWPTNRFTEDQRAKVNELRPRPDPEAYVSPVQPGRIFWRPKRTMFWAGVIVLCLTTLGVTHRLGRA